MTIKVLDEQEKGRSRRSKYLRIVGVMRTAKAGFLREGNGEVESMERREGRALG